LGAMALFGEKYPDFVRVVTMGDFSREFCGGTHLSNTGQVGLCRIVKEELIAAGIRRVTCLTGPKALQRIRETEGLVEQLAGLLKASQPDELPRKVQQLQDDLRHAKQELSKYTAQSLANTAAKLVANAETIGATKLVVHQVTECGREQLKEFVDRLREQSPSIAILLGLVVEDKVAFIGAASRDLVSNGVSASDAVKTAAKIAGGGGGGRLELAEAGGKNPAKIGEALAAGAEYLRSKLKS
jgi:alanyl-tRNA synthetase